MKKFSLKKMLRGDRVETRDGNQVECIRYFPGISIYAIKFNTKDIVYSVNRKGENVKDATSTHDLVMSKKTKPKHNRKAWVVMYTPGGSVNLFVSKSKAKEFLKNRADPEEHIISKITWYDER